MAILKNQKKINIQIQSDSDSVFIKNEKRHMATQRQVSPYVPNYKTLSVNPIKMNSQVDIHKEVSSLDGSIIDEDYNTELGSGEIIDNNEFVNLDPMNNPYQAPKSRDNIEPDNKSISEGSYILMVNGNVILSGHQSLIEDNIASMLCGRHPDFEGSVDIEDIVVLKRVGVKFGVSLEDL